MHFIKKYLPKKIYSYLIDIYNYSINPFFSKSYSQEGEDIILKRYFENKKKGFYVDVGAFHPVRFSNTFLFYKMGWSGINIEPRPGSKLIFDKIRKRDINIEAAISNEINELVYYKFNEPALNSFSKELSEKRNNMGKYKIIEKIKVPSTTIAEILDKNLPTNLKIDFMSIDAEGFDLNVLKSNNWQKYRPNFVLVEDIGFNLMEPLKSEVFKFMVNWNYNLVAKSFNTLFFQSEKNS